MNQFELYISPNINNELISTELINKRVNNQLKLKRIECAMISRIILPPLLGT